MTMSHTRRFTLSLLFAVLLAWPASASAAPRIQTVSFQSEALGGERRYRVYVPPGYHKSRKRYPVIILLHGLGGSGQDWFTSGRLADTVDRLIKKRVIRPVILVAPDGGDGYWTDHRPTKESTAADRRNYGTFVTEEVLSDVDRRLRTRLGERAVAGVSMGGHGAMSVGLQFPERFRAIVSLGGALFPTPPSHRAIYKRVWGDPVNDAHWRATSPMALIEARPLKGSKAQGLTPFPPIYLHCGDDDEFGFLPYALAAHERLRERGIDHQLRVSDGGHSWTAWRSLSEDWLHFVDRQWVGGGANK
ncbi:MAG: enterochelin esterase-like enzyme [Myxococcota bacterium]|jgi:enterochelin esterase-like enzyme